MDTWEDFWKTIKPGTLFIVRRPGHDTQLLRMMAPCESHHTEDSLFNCIAGTIHHRSEFFLFEEGLQAVRDCIIAKHGEQI